ncbi:MAG: hypothetical protein Ct9H300mP18_14760 [Candidatus Neomarinimicrobiota bacterium]|nr:MAG: hypothetical protein Ct9H300mP18_14760 [Candidatus Neomarinimicrobiota bacterium]
MVKNSEHISGSFLIFRLILIFFFSPLVGPKKGFPQKKGGLLGKDSTFYPGKPLIMSLIVPGLGQLYNKEPIWKPRAIYWFRNFKFGKHLVCK